IRQNFGCQAASRFADEPVFGAGYRFSGRDQFVEAVASPAYGAPTARAYSIHNDYLEQIVDGGAVGGSIFILLLGTMVAVARNLLRHSADFVRGLALACTLAALFVAMTASAVLPSAAAAVIVWLFFGIAAAAAQRSDASCA